MKFGYQTFDSRCPKRFCGWRYRRICGCLKMRSRPLSARRCLSGGRPRAPRRSRPCRGREHDVAGFVEQTRQEQLADIGQEVEEERDGCQVRSRQAVSDDDAKHCNDRSWPHRSRTRATSYKGQREPPPKSSLACESVSATSISHRFNMLRPTIRRSPSSG